MALLSSPQSTGLFSRAVALSGSPNITMDLPAAQASKPETHTAFILPCQSSPLDPWLSITLLVVPHLAWASHPDACLTADPDHHMPACLFALTGAE